MYVIGFPLLVGSGPRGAIGHDNCGTTTEKARKVIHPKIYGPLEDHFVLIQKLSGIYGIGKGMS